MVVVSLQILLLYRTPSPDLLFQFFNPSFPVPLHCLRPEDDTRVDPTHLEKE